MHMPPAQNPLPSQDTDGTLGTLVPPVQIPLWQVAPSMHGLPHAVPSAFGVSLHVPVAGSQPEVKHGFSGGGQTIGSPPTHVPHLQVPPPMQRLPPPAPHGVPSGARTHMPF
jgi:hypothetical protein